MRLRVFRARNASLAIAAAREAMGEEAVVLGTRRVGGGVELTVAWEAVEPELIPPVATPRFELARHNLPPALRFAGSDLAEALAARLDFAPLPLERPILLVGPPGAGKTLSCAKLAARAAMAGQSPLIVTADGARAGAVEQLAAFTRLLGLTLAVAAQPEVLAKALQARRPGQPAFIDGFGCDPFDAAQAELLHRLAQAADATPVLVLPAGLDAEESAELARAFHLLGARHLLPTRLDMARRLGGVLSAAAAGLALTEAGIGPQVAAGLQPLTAIWLAGRLVAGPQRETSAC
ncbi:GTP-binding protein [Roseococcus sp.]|uniref:flagellar biosynthesis protein FlhF n=1 Tax=Roseococcus sp. TaxID=2109646 RepID=UPI003BAC73E4